jgi:DNA polymerase-1
MSRYLFDIEGDGLLDAVTRIWCVYLEDIDTGEELEYIVGRDDGWQDIMYNAKLLVGHNVVGYDFPAMLKVLGWRPNSATNIHDTLLMSQSQDFWRFGREGHSLRRWGEFFGFPKVEHEDWSQWSLEMGIRCRVDVRLNMLVYRHLMGEFQQVADVHPQFRHYLRAEHAVAKWSAKANYFGWPFDKPGAVALFAKMDDQLNATIAALEYKLGSKAVAVDKLKGEVAVKVPKWNANGDYNHHVAKWFDIDADTGSDEETRLVDGPYCRVLFEPLLLSSVTDVKVFLYRNGWIPTEWNTKRDEVTRRNVRTSPKITEDSLEFLGEDGTLYLEYLTTKSRHGILKSWIANVDDIGRLRGDCMVIGTPSMRMRHSGIVNVPSADSTWGKEMRSLFIAAPGWKIVGCDSAGNQARGLAHFLQSQDYIDLLLRGDIHQYNADLLTKVMHSLGFDITCLRPNAKRALYATLFGASGAKLFGYVAGYQDAENGNKLKDGFLKGIPGFKRLMDKLEAQFEKTKKGPGKRGYITGLAGNRIYCDSKHKLLVYLLQAAEKATCGAAVMLTMRGLEAAGIEYYPLIMMHDEFQVMVREERAEETLAIGVDSFREGPKLFGVTIMDGDGKIGNSWYETH